MVKIYSIEGNIGSGKSTLLKELKNKYKNHKEIYFLKEPVNIWTTIKDKDNKNIIEKFYENQEKYGFKFQMMAYISRLNILKEALKNKEIKVIITERSLQTDKNIFCKMLYNDGKIDEIGYQIYNRWFDTFLGDYENVNFIYLKTDYKISYERILKRNRKGEEDIPIEYIKLCDKYHNDWLNNEEPLILNGNIDINDNYKKHLEKIDNNIFKIEN